MPDPTPNDGFTFELNEVEKAVKESLPQAADYLGDPIPALIAQDWLGGPGNVPQAGKTQEIYLQYKDLLCRHQCQVVDVAHTTAAALQDVINVYRRADGQA